MLTLVIQSLWILDPITRPAQFGSMHTSTYMISLKSKSLRGTKQWFSDTNVMNRNIEQKGQPFIL